MISRALRIYTEEGSLFVARFDPVMEYRGILWGHATVLGYSEVAGKQLRIMGKTAEPQPGGRLLIEDRPWSIEYVEGEEVPLYEYETIVKVEDITHLLEQLDVVQEAK